MKDYEAYLFDWDGTLSQTLDVWLRVLRTLYNKYGLYPSDTEIAQLFGDWEAAEKLGLASEKLPDFVKELEGAAHHAVSRATLYPGAKETLISLREQGKKTALITSSVRVTIDAVLGHHDLVELFDVVITGNDVTEHKPNPESLLYTIKELGVSADESIMIGDSDKDILAAKNAKIDSMLFYPSSHETFYNKSYLQGLNPTYVIDNLRNIIG